MKQKTLLRTLSALLAITTVVFFACQKEVKQGSLSSNDLSNGKKTTAYEVPTLTCGDGSTLYSIDLVVTAGLTTGAASGFSVQWIAKDVLDAYTGPLDYAGFPTDSALYCRASFSGNANISRYNLTAGQSVHVTIGDILLDNGASTPCPDALTCGTAYVFRVFAHGDSKMNQSRFGGSTTCSTLACDETCTHFGFGHWKALCPDLPVPAEGITLGTSGHLYTAAELCEILNENPADFKFGHPSANGLINVAHQLIAAKLNGIGSPNTDAAEAYIGNLIVPTATNGSTAWKSAASAAGIVGSLHHDNETCQ